jgi:hypothetical protein
MLSLQAIKRNVIGSTIAFSTIVQQEGAIKYSSSLL